MQVKAGDKKTFLAVRWQDGDNIVAIIEPYTKYYNVGWDCRTHIEDMCCSVVSGSEIVNDVEWPMAASPLALKKIALETFVSGKIIRSEIREIVRQEIEFYTDDMDNLNFRVVFTEVISGEGYD